VHKYFFHVGDFDRATRHLNRIERSVYRDLIDLYMDTESMLDADLQRLCRRIIATTEQESTAVEQVLNEFFILTDNGWFNSRCDEELNAYKSNKSHKSDAGKASAEAKRLRKQQVIESNRCSTGVQQVLNSVSTERQLTSNHKPVTNNQEREPTPDGDSGKKPVSPKASRIAPDWQPDEVLMAWAKAERSDLHLPTTIASFRDYWIGKSGKDATKADWSATFRNWVRREKGNAPAQSKPADPWAGRDF